MTEWTPDRLHDQGYDGPEEVTPMGQRTVLRDIARNDNHRASMVTNAGYPAGQATSPPRELTDRQRAILRERHEPETWAAWQRLQGYRSRLPVSNLSGLSGPGRSRPCIACSGPCRASGPPVRRPVLSRGSLEVPGRPMAGPGPTSGKPQPGREARASTREQGYRKAGNAQVRGLVSRRGDKVR